jgi:hypothetical protein
MEFQQHMIDVTRKAAEEAFRYAKAVPADKREWKVLDQGRTVLDQAREMAKCPDWAYDIIAGEKELDWSEDAMAEQQKAMAEWSTVEQCEQECYARLERLFGLYASISDERLKETKWLPFDGGKDFTVAEMMDYPRWNFTYHAGQIAFIQTLYGDKDMH